MWQWMMADPIVPNMRKDIVSYLRIIANEIAIVCLQLSDGTVLRGGKEQSVPRNDHTY